MAELTAPSRSRRIFVAFLWALLVSLLWIVRIIVQGTGPGLVAPWTIVIDALLVGGYSWAYYPLTQLPGVSPFSKSQLTASLGTPWAVSVFILLRDAVFVVLGRSL